MIYCLRWFSQGHHWLYSRPLDAHKMFERTKGFDRWLRQKITGNEEEQQITC